MLHPSIEDAMNNQIKMELGSAYAYLAMSAQFEEQSLTGFAKWMRIQSEEELGHAMKFYDFIHDRNGRVVFQALEEPRLEVATPLQAFEKSLAQERKVTAAINAIYALAVREGDYASQAFLDWFVKEQVEEEKNAEQAVDHLRMAGDNAAALLMLDREMGQRSGD